MFDRHQRAYLGAAPVGRLATADASGHPHVVPICFALWGEAIVSSIDEKPQTASPRSLQRSRDIRENPRVSLVVDHYREDWADLGWVQVRGRADHLAPGDDGHDSAIAELQAKYDQYASHDLAGRPAIRIEPTRILSWGTLDPPAADGV